MNVIPAVLPKNYEDWIKQGRKAVFLSHFIQVDVCDGEVTPFTSFIPAANSVPHIDVEYDIMAKDWYSYACVLAVRRPRSIVFHVDGFDVYDAAKLSDFLLEANFQVRLSISLDSDIEGLIKLASVLMNYKRGIDFQVMGIAKIGVQGQDFDVRALRMVNILRNTFPNSSISVDGGIDLDSARAVGIAGADTVVSGSFLSHEKDSVDRYVKLLSISGLV